MTKDNQSDKPAKAGKPGFSRRGFLSGVAVGAVGSALGREAMAQGFFVIDENGNLVPLNPDGSLGEPITTNPTPPPVDPPDPGPSSGGTAIRQNVYSLDPNGATMSAMRRGVQAMMSRPATDPRSWMFQANIHGFSTGVPPGLPPEMQAVWATCEHSNGFFLSWHRMYLYFFERILRAASGDPGFALPYWDYGVPGQASLPPAFRQQGSPLFRTQRSSNANNGRPIPGDTTSSFNAMQQMVFGPFGFNSALESQPHNGVHGAIGGNFGLMSRTTTAGQDPIFWLHHCNIDRMWNRWIALGGGRSNPTNDANFMNRPYAFYDETGARRTMSGRDVLDTAAQLGYAYDDDQPPARGFSPAPVQVASASGARGAFESGVAALAQSSGGVTLGGGTETVRLRSAFEAAGPAAFMTRSDNRSAPQRTILLLDDIDFDAPTGTWYNIYVNLPAGVAPDPRGPYYAGLFAPFAQNRSNEPTGYDITGLLNRQVEAGLFDGGEVDVRFIARDNAGPEESGVAPADVRIGDVRIIRQ